MLSSYFLIAEVLRPHGIQGEVKVKTYTEDLENLKQVKTLYQKKGEDFLPLNVQKVHVHQGDVLLAFEGITTRNDAERLRNVALFLHRNDASPLAEGEFYLQDIFGFAVVTEQGETLGELVDVLTTYIQNVYVVKVKQGQMLFPEIKGIIEKVDFTLKQVVVNATLFHQVAVEA